MNRIKELRIEKKLTQSELGKKIGVSDASINKYEKELMTPKIDKLEKMAETFQVSVDYLTGKSDSRTGYSDHWDNISKKINTGITNPLPPLAKDKDLARKALLLDFEKLNELGRKEALKQVKNLSKIIEYTE